MNVVKQQSNLQHIWTILCSSSSIDQSTNNISLYNIIEQIAVKKPPMDNPGPTPSAVNIQVELITLWKKMLEGTSVEGEQKVDFIDPEDTVLHSHTSKIFIPEKLRRLRSRNKISGLKFTIDGEYAFRVSVREGVEQEFRVVFELPLQVLIDSQKPGT
ncbi:MAG: hypothetical protein A2760_02705 [Candidatus Doudnabacteria bacterium RIFCSPHIGHO2_01_FULL_50_67]|nr:MAG: hypothetical protein A2760_02705 [Candidatus Doudnabacteria bacterium RIFCSPHIGHO2_01_FULL_50_67]